MAFVQSICFVDESPVCEISALLPGVASFCRQEKYRPNEVCKRVVF